MSTVFQGPFNLSSSLELCIRRAPATESHQNFSDARRSTKASTLRSLELSTSFKEIVAKSSPPRECLSDKISRTTESLVEGQRSLRNRDQPSSTAIKMILGRGNWLPVRFADNFPTRECGRDRKSREFHFSRAYCQSTGAEGESAAGNLRSQAAKRFNGARRRLLPFLTGGRSKVELDGTRARASARLVLQSRGTSGTTGVRFESTWNRGSSAKAS